MASKPRQSRKRPESAPRQRAAISPYPTLIAVELGSEWPRWMSEVVGEGPRKVLCQLEGEDCIAFAARVAESMAESASHSSALLLCNERADARQMAARRRLLTALCERRPTRLCLSASVEAREELRTELGRLVAELPEAELRFGTLTESVRKASKLRSVA